MLNFHLSSNQLAVQEKARRFALQEVLPVAWYYDAKDEIPMKIIRKAFDAGFLSADIPKTYGGYSLGLMESALINRRNRCSLPGTGYLNF